MPFDSARRCARSKFLARDVLVSNAQGQLECVVALRVPGRAKKVQCCPCPGEGWHCRCQAVPRGHFDCIANCRIAPSGRRFGGPGVFPSRLWCWPAPMPDARASPADLAGRTMRPCDGSWRSLARKRVDSEWCCAPALARVSSRHSASEDGVKEEPERIGGWPWRLAAQEHQT